MIQKFKTTYVFGDLHADHYTFRNMLIDLRIIDRNGRMVAKDIYIVQIGDVLDGKARGYHEHAIGEEAILDLLDSLAEQAPALGSRVFCLIGNHEFMNFTGDFRYVSPGDMTKSGGEEARLEKYSPGGVLARRMACSRIAILNIDGLLFVHGGINKNIAGELKDNPRMVDSINRKLKDFLEKNVSQGDPDIKRFFIDKDSLLWDRTLGSDSIECEKILSLGHIIVGHTVQPKINSKCDRKIWRVDTGISQAFGNKKQVLVIGKDRNSEYRFNVVNV